MLAALGGERDQHGQVADARRRDGGAPRRIAGLLLCPPRGGDGVPYAVAGHYGEPVRIARGGARHRGGCGGRGMGKSIVGMHLCHYAASKGPRGRRHSRSRWTNDALVTRLIASIARVDAQKMRAGYLNAEGTAMRVFKAAQQRLKTGPCGWTTRRRARSRR